MFDFLGISKSLKNFANELSSIRLDIETLSREIEDIQYAPAHLDDVVQALTIWATGQAGKYQEYFKAVIFGLLNRPSDLTDSYKVYRHLSSMEFLAEPSVNRPISRDMQMCGLLGPSVFVDMVKKQIESMERPPSGLTLAERALAISALEKKIEKLRSTEAALLKSAEKAGLSVS